MDIPPSKLYKYFAPSRSHIFNDWLIRFTQPGALNDPFEMRPHIAGYGTPEEVFEIAANKWERHNEYEYREYVKRHGNIINFEDYRARMERRRLPMIHEAIAKSPENNTAMARKINEMMNNSVGILSLSASYDNFIMWAHYGHSHRGFVVEFDTASPFFKQERPPIHANANEEEAAQFAEEYGRLRVVHYSDERPSVVVTKMSFDVLLTKGIPWKHEDEWRMLMPLEYADERRSESLVYPLYLFKIPPNAVTKIILGGNCDADLVRDTLSLRSRDETRHIAIEKARIDERHFQLNFEPVQ